MTLGVVHRHGTRRDADAGVNARRGGVACVGYERGRTILSFTNEGQTGRALSLKSHRTLTWKGAGDKDM